MSTALRLALVGAAGRMGRAVTVAAGMADDISIVAAIGRGDALKFGNADVVIDLSHADAVAEICSASVREKRALIIGTTGHSPSGEEEIRTASQQVPLLVAANFSVGINVLLMLARNASAMLGDEWDIEIIETHHRRKKDAPSGTAKRLADALCESRGLDPSEALVHGREGMTGERPRGEIGVHAIRGGDVVGDHTVLFASDGERVELTHRASSRATFALGALRAARWIADKPAGLYGMEDVLR